MKSYSFAPGPIKPFQTKEYPTGLCQAWRGLTVLLLVLGLALALLSPAAAADGALDPSFITGPGPYAGVQTIPEFRGNYGYPTVTGAPYNGYQLFFGNFYGMTVGTNFYQYNSLCRWTNTGQLDTSFVNPQINGEIRAVYIYPHDDPIIENRDKILVAGSFNIFSGNSQYANFARLNANGSLDTTLTQAIYWGGGVSTVAVQGSGTAAKILLGGYNLATNMNGGPRYQLIRLKYDGSLDGTYNHWGAPGGLIYSIRVNDPFFPNAVRVYCSYPKNQNGLGGTYYMLLLNSNAALPSITTPLASIGDELVDGPVLNLTRQSDGKWLICGQFKNVYNTATSTWVPRNRVARLGSNLSTLDTTYDVGVGPNASVNSIMPMNTSGSPSYDDRMVLAGNFSTWNGGLRGYLVRLNIDGTLDNTFNSGTGANDIINRLTWNSDGSGGMIYGYFRAYNSSTRGCIAALNGDGSLNTGYNNVSATAGGCGTVYSLAAQSDGKIIIGGDFNGVGGKYHSGLARINPDGSPDPSFIGGVDGIVRSVAVQADGKILLAGSFGGCNKWSRTSLARLNPDSSLDTTFKPMLVGPQDNSLNNVYHVVPLANGQIMIAGELYNASGPTGTPATRLNSDGSFDFSFNASQFGISGTDWYWCSRLAAVGSNYVIAGGYDTTGMGGGGGFLARLNSTGALDTSFGPSSHVQTMDGQVADLLMQPDGKIVVSGMFSQVIDGSVARRAIARFSANGLLDSTFTPSLTPPTGASTIVLAAMAGQPNGKILIEANFLNNLGGSNYNYVSTQVARLNSNGSLDPNFSLGNISTTSASYYPGSGNSILRLPKGKALIGGVFSNYNGQAAWSLVRIIAGPVGFFDPGFLFLLLND